MAVAGERIGGYQLVRLIARGGMATVYEARQPALDRLVALKRLDLRTDDQTLVDRFIRESRIAAAFDHPNIVTVFDFFEFEGVPYIAMEYLPRGSLRPCIGRLSDLQVFGILESVRSRGLRLSVSAQSRAQVALELRLSRSLARSRGLRDRVIGRASGRVAGGRSLTAAIRLTRRARRALDSATELEATVRLELPKSTGPDRFLSEAVTL